MFQWLWNAIGQRSVKSGENENAKDELSNESQPTEPPVVNDSVDIATDTSTDLQDNAVPQSRYTNDSDNDNKNNSNTTSTKQAQVETDDFYCPYRDCTYSTEIISTLCNHIAEHHDDGFNTGLTEYLATKRLRCASTGAFISLRNPNLSLDPHERLSSKPYFYCPYRGCSSFTKKRTDIKVHIRSEHYHDLARQAKFFWTPDKGMITFSFQERSSLPPGELILPCDEHGNVPKKFLKLIKKPTVDVMIDQHIPSSSLPSKRESTSVEGPADDKRTRSNPKRRKRKPFKDDEWEFY